MDYKYIEIDVTKKLSLLLFFLVAISHAIHYTPQHSGILFIDATELRYLTPGEHSARSSTTQVYSQPSAGLTIHEASIWSIHASPHLPFVASAGADGSVRIANVNRVWEKRGKGVMVVDVYTVAEKEDGWEFGCGGGVTVRNKTRFILWDFFC